MAVIQHRTKTATILKMILLALLIPLYGPLHGQQFGLYNSRTLYDTFENPSQSAFQVDSSRRLAFNFLIPTISANTKFKGPAEANFKSLIYDGRISGRELVLGENQLNDLYINSNNYIGMFRILHKVKHNQELGLSWQIKSEGELRVPNEAFAVFDDYRLFTEPMYTGLFNSKGYSQNYHQFSMNYRRNLTKRLSVGVKGSLLSGIAYTRFDVINSALAISEGEDAITLGLQGRLRSNFKYDRFEKRMLLPDFKNAGAAISAGAGYKARDGWFVMGTLKDLGFIRWSKKSYEYLVNINDLEIENASAPDADDRLADSLSYRIDRAGRNKGYFSAVNSKAEVLVSKDLGNYQPNLIVSKNLFYRGGDIVLVNNYSYRDLVFTLSGDYHTSGLMSVGGQFMIKSPNAEFYLGSDHLFKSIGAYKEYNNDVHPYSSGPVAGSVYIGFGLKFGRVLEHPANANYIPGIEVAEDRRNGFFRRLFRRN